MIIDGDEGGAGGIVLPSGLGSLIDWSKNIVLIDTVISFEWKVININAILLLGE